MVKQMLTAKKLQFGLLLFVVLSQAYSQQSGLPFIRNFSPQEYKAGPQNWGIAQDQRGVMYFGNNDGILEFDGVSWRLIKLPGVSPIAVDSTGRVFVGLDNDIGYIQPGDNGNFQYHSLQTKINEIHREINICYRVFVMGEQVIYQTADKIYIYERDTIKVITSGNGFHLSFLVDHHFYVLEPGKGLLCMQNDSLKLIAGGELLAKDQIVAMMPFRQNEILIATLTRGILVYSPENSLHLYKPGKFKKVDDFLKKNQAYSGTQLTNGHYALGTIIRGIIEFNEQGEMLHVYNKSNGLQDNSIYILFCDKNQQIWATLDNGISLIHNNIPFRQFTDKNGLNGTTICLRYYNNSLYVGTGQSLHIQDRKGNFEPLAGTESQNFDLCEANGILLLANLSGISEIKGKQVTRLANTSDISALSFCHLKDKPAHLLAGATNGIYLLQYEHSSWRLKNKIKGFNRPAYKIDEDKEGNIWVSTFLDLYQLKIDPALDSVISVRLFTTKHGLPSNYAMTYTLNSGEIVFCTEKGAYSYLSDQDRFVPHSDFGMLTGKLTQFIQAQNDDIWFEQLCENGRYEKGVIKLRNGQYVVYKTPFYKFNDLGSGDCPFNICFAPDGSVFFGTVTGLLQYIPSVEINYGQPFNTLIRKVTAKDSLLFGGAKTWPSKGKSSVIQEIPYSQNNIILHFAAMFYENAEKNEYSCRLIGLDTTWSEWTNDHKKEYTNLSEGRYVFEVKSKNQYQVTGSTDSYSFRILPPWYRSWWAYITYIILLAVFLVFIMKIYARRLEKQKQRLENIVTQRTAKVLVQKKEIQDKNEELNRTNTELRTTLNIVNSQKGQIETANRQIIDQNKELKEYRDHLEQLVDERTQELLKAKNKAEESDKLKTSFLQNLSHEIRTPMNGIIGFLNLLEEPGLDDESKTSYIKTINQSGQRLLQTINDIVEISKIEAKQITVHPATVNLTEVMDYHMKFFEQQAGEKGISLILSTRIPDKQAFVVTDKVILDNILTNLINNAIKFTHKGTVEVGSYLEENSMVFFVRDTGIGIPANRTEVIFKRFVQANVSNTRGYEGSGLGLSIVKEYLDILHGKIWVESKLGEGSTFFFSLPYKAVPVKETTIREIPGQGYDPGKKLTLLIAEDDEYSFFLIKNILRRYPIDILRATNGKDTLSMVKDNPGISLILMDIKMPELDGYEATRLIRKKNKTIPIIAYTAYALTSDKEKAIEAGCNDYISKPIDGNQLIQLIRKYTQ